MQLNNILRSFKQKGKTQKNKIKFERTKNYNKTTTGWAVAWFLQLSTLPNTTQFSTFYYFLLQYYFSSPDIYYFSNLITFSCLFLATHIFCLLDFYTSYFYILSHLHLHFYIYVLPSSLFITSMSSTSTNVAMPLLKFWVSNFSIRFFFSCTGTFVHFISFHFFFFWGFLVYRMQICFGFKNNFFFFFWGTNFMPAESWISADIYRNTQNRPKWPEIFSQVKWGGLLFRLFIDTIFSGHYGWNGMELITLNRT